jgi:hypothetical protein
MVALSSTLVTLLTACSSGTSEEHSEAAPSGSSGPALGHVHGLGVDPADGALYIASHTGVYRFPKGGAVERVADRYQDTMGFAIVGPGHFLASGHPDARENLPVRLGLIESKDGAKTWTAVSLQGEADFHAIEPAGDRIYAYDSVSGALVVTTNRRTWTAMERRPLLDLAADPGDPGVLLATTPQGELLRSTKGSALAAVAGAPRLGPLDWETDGPLVGVGADGTVMVSSDGGATWAQKGTLEGVVEALDVTRGRWHAATDRAIFESTDDGQTWRPVQAGGTKH